MALSSGLPLLAHMMRHASSIYRAVPGRATAFAAEIPPAGRLAGDTLINNLAREWASLPMISGKGAYAGQNAAVKPDRVQQALADVERRHQEAQPLREIVVEKEIDKPVVPISVEAEIRKRTDRWSWLTTIFGSGGAGLAALAGMDWQTVMAIGALAMGGLFIALLLRRQIVCAVRNVRRMIEG